MSRRLVCLIGVALVSWFCAAESRVALAGNAFQAYLPHPSPTIKIKRTRVEIVSSWVGGDGYRPFKVTVLNYPPGPTKYDRDFRVGLRLQNYASHNSVRTEAVIEMPAGSAEGSAWIAVPQYGDWDTLALEVREGGARLDEVSDEHLNVSNPNYHRNGSEYSEAIPGVLFIDSHVPPRQTRETWINNVRNNNTSKNPSTHFLPDARLWEHLVPQFDYANNGNNNSRPSLPTDETDDAKTLKAFADHDKMEILPPDELPDQWLHYTCLDMIFIGIDDAQDLAKQRPAVWEAITRWAASGSTLIITGVKDDFSRLADVEKLLPTQADKVSTGALRDHPTWVAADNSYTFTDYRALEPLINNHLMQRYGSNPSPMPVSPENRRFQSDKTPFGIRTLGTGRVVAFATTTPVTNPVHDMSWMLNQLDERTLTPYKQRGISYSRGNPEFINFLVEGTGQAPVLSFLVLITGFVVIIGPVNYLLLQRWRRLFLLLVTVPFGAALITLSLFAYAMFSDGLGVQVRGRSYTRLDQRTGDVVNWGRQAYYAGLAPSGGLNFPNDVAVYPIDDRENGRNSNNALPRHLAWTDDQQQLRRGYIRSRETAQFLVVSSDKSEHKLEITPGKGDASPKVVNQLGAEIEHLLLRDQRGNYYATSKLPLDDSRELTKIEKLEIVRALEPFAKAHRVHQMQPPFGYDQRNTGFGFNRYYGAQYYGNQAYDPPSFQTSLLDRELTRICNAKAGDEMLPPRSYLALLKGATEMPIGHAWVRERGSFHVLEGRW